MTDFYKPGEYGGSTLCRTMDVNASWLFPWCCSKARSSMLRKTDLDSKKEAWAHFIFPSSLPVVRFPDLMGRIARDWVRFFVELQSTLSLTVLFPWFGDMRFF